MSWFFRSFAFLLLCVLPAAAQQRPDAATAFARAGHLRHGVNLSHWFSQNSWDYSAHHTETETTPDDLALIAHLGFDHVRLSVDAAPLEADPRGPEGMNAAFLDRLDRAVDQALAQGLAVQLDLHPESSFKQPLRSSDDAVDRFVMLWRRLAAHYSDRDPERLFFEILNEPEVNDAYRWAGIQARAAAAIRQAAPRQTLIATGANYSNLTDLLALQPLADGNVIYTFHFYEPHEFTHQGANWGSSWWIYESKIPYPPDEALMRDRLSQIPDPVYRSYLENYWLNGWNAHRIRLLIDEAADWARSNQVPLICNEFGVYRRAVDPESRLRWLRDVRTALEADGIGWSMWDFHGDFGVVTSGHGATARVDRATQEALGVAEK